MGSASPSPSPAAMMDEKLDPNVDWKALKLVYAPMYSAFDGAHTFQVPVRVDGASVELSGWKAIPKDAATFDPDPEGGGVMVTIVKGVPEITIAASNKTIGGTATLHITVATPADWEVGKARYNNGVDFELPEPPDFSQIIDPNFVPPPPPKNLACNNCHSTGAKYFEVQHTPTQAARFSDDDLSVIFTKGMKPPGIGFRIFPDPSEVPMVSGLPAFDPVEVYAGFHTWDASAEEIKGLIVYLRSLTPTGQGDILLPDGTYLPPGEIPSNAPGAAGAGGR